MQIVKKETFISALIFFVVCLHRALCDTVNHYRSPPRTRRSSASSVSSGGGPPVSARNRSRSPSSSLQAPRSNCGDSSTGLDSLNVNSGRRSITPTRSRSPTPRLSVTKAPSSYGGSNTGLNTSGRTSRNRSRSPTPRPPSRNKNTSSLPADNNNNGGDTTSTTVVPPDQQSLNDSGSEVSDEGYRSLGVVASSAVDGAVVKTCHEEAAVVESEDAQHSGNGQYLRVLSGIFMNLIKRNRFVSA